MEVVQGFQRDVLFAIKSKKEASGSEIIDILNQYYQEKVKGPRVYLNLTQLEEDGYINKEPIDGRKDGHHLTEKGEQAIEKHVNWLDELLTNEEQELTAL
jgi:DNA-binding PadR family transcriptional regulator